MKKKTFILQPANLLRNLESQSAIWIKKKSNYYFSLVVTFPHGFVTLFDISFLYEIRIVQFSWVKKELRFIETRD